MKKIKNEEYEENIKNNNKLKKKNFIFRTKKILYKKY